ncbi:hypothetical protein MKW92_011228 [Papaver armeniacum]|nr:hypothetical protein MKW92_011228 [Papaver armeniacum]
MASILETYERSLVERTKYHLGYPTHVYVNYSALSNLRHFCINNCGNPFAESISNLFARLWGIRKDEYWGYITTGGTEGNFHGILVGFPDGIVYTSDDSHYSVFRAAQMYRMNCVKVDSLISGEIDCADFKAKLLRNKNKPAILNVNIARVSAIETDLTCAFLFILLLIGAVCFLLILCPTPMLSLLKYFLSCR